MAKRKSDLLVFAERYGINMDLARKLSRLVGQYANRMTHCLNGDPHRRVRDREDKNANAVEWEKDSEKTADRLAGCARECGFEAVDYSGGLYPTFRKGTDQSIYVP